MTVYIGLPLQKHAEGYCNKNYLKTRTLIVLFQFDSRKHVSCFNKPRIFFVKTLAQTQSNSDV